MAEHPRTILVVEDDHDTRVSLRWTLEEEGYLVQTAANGLVALQLLSSSPKPDLILLDLLMPLMSGEELLRAIKSDPQFHDIPVILITAYPDTARNLVTSQFLHKPVQLSTLLNVVGQSWACSAG